MRRARRRSAISAVSSEKSFAVTILFLMFFPALPLPTGGVTHVFEVITVLLAVEMVIGARSIWLPADGRIVLLGRPRRRRQSRS